MSVTAYTHAAWSLPSALCSQMRISMAQMPMLHHSSHWQRSPAAAASSHPAVVQTPCNGHRLHRQIYRGHKAQHLYLLTLTDSALCQPQAWHMLPQATASSLAHSLTARPCTLLPQRPIQDSHLGQTQQKHNLGLLQLQQSARTGLLSQRHNPWKPQQQMQQALAWPLRLLQARGLPYSGIPWEKLPTHQTNRT